MKISRAKVASGLAFSTLSTLTMLAALPAGAHDLWSNGAKVPAWVKKSCCGPSEAHHLSATSVRALPDGYHVDGLATAIPYSRVLPSRDGEFWGFWNPDASHPVVFCFFAPPSVL